MKRNWTNRVDRAITRNLQTPQQLRQWLRIYLGLNVPAHPVCTNHHAPFEYLRRAYFEPASDLVVWAPRGGGKTRLGAAATLLDLLHKPGCAVRILGGSLEQSLRMWEHLHPDLLKLAHNSLAGKDRARRIELKNLSSVAVLTQSQRAVRGLRVQKLRCDEVELFDPLVWEAAQLITRSKATIRGAVEAISTLHTPFGLMQRVVDDATAHNIPVIKWCLMEVLERCPADRDCAHCPLHDDCKSLAKTRCEGFVKIDDAIAMKRRVSIETWEAEMLCKRPSIRNCVFPTFNLDLHLREDPLPAGEISLAIDFGFSNPFVCLWIHQAPDGQAHVIDEYIQPQQTIDRHIDQIRSRPWPNVSRIACDPAGAARNTQTAISDVHALRQAGFCVHHRSSAIVQGLELIRAALRPAAGPPTLFIHPRCKHLIRCMQSYHYADNGSELPLKDGTNDHPIDALRYFFVNRTAAKLAGRRY